MERQQDQIKDCRVTVIGGAGFLGSHLVNHLIDNRNCDVQVIDDLCSGQKKNVNQRAFLELFDITGSEEVLFEMLHSFSPEWVFNYAARPYIPECYTDPKSFFDTNATAVMTLLNIIEEMPDVRGFLQVSSAELYGEVKVETSKITEEHPVIPHSTYGVAKAAADGLVQVRWKEAGVRAIALRQFNCIGERETHEYVVPEIISQLADSNVVKLGNNSTRDFMYAGDAVRMSVELLENGQFGEVYNLGSQDEIHIYDLARLIGSIMEYPEVEIVQDKKRMRPWEIWRLCSDNTKIHSTIDYRPKVGLKEALTKTVNYFKENGFKWDF